MQPILKPLRVLHVCRRDCGEAGAENGMFGVIAELWYDGFFDINLILGDLIGSLLVFISDSIVQAFFSYKRDPFK
jgi:hypothetical protein